MSKSNTAIYEYECNDCHHRCEVLMTFNKSEPFDRDEQGRERPAGYPEQHPECPTCHSHDVVRVNIRAVE